MFDRLIIFLVGLAAKYSLTMGPMLDKGSTRRAGHIVQLYFCSVLQPSLIWGYFIHLSLSSAIVIDSSMVRPVHVLMLSIQAVYGPPYLCVPALFIALYLPPGKSLVSLWCDHSMLASLFWQSLIVPPLLQLCRIPTPLFSLLSTKLAVSSSVLSSQRHQVSSFHSHTLLQAILALSLVMFSLK